MKRTRYDLVFGVGNACSATQTLREANLQFESFPFDWVAYKSERDLDERIEMLRTDFAHWFDKTDLAFAGNFDFGWHARAIYHNRRTGVVFNHDFNRGEDFDAAYDGVAKKYRRRAERLFARIRASKRVLVFRLDRPDQKVPTSAESCLRLKRMLEAKFPVVAFDILLMTHDPTVLPGCPREVRLSDGVLKISFDCHCDDPRAPVYQPDFFKTAKVLSRYAVAVDYRTPAERRRFRELRRREHWAKFGATTFWGYLWAKLARRTR